MTTINRFRIRALCAALAVAVGFGVADPVDAHQQEWARQPGTTALDHAFGVATDPQGNVYVAGATDGSLAGPNRGRTDAWIKKYSTAGVLLWKRQLGTSDIDVVNDIATDDTGNVYIVGRTRGSLGGINHGGNDLGGVHDAWIAKYSASGALLWKRQPGTAGYDFAQAVATDHKGNVYIAGGTTGPLGGTHLGENDGWIMKFSATGTLLWKRQVGTPVGDYISDVATDMQGNVFIAGSTAGSLAGPNRGMSDVWIAKFSAGGVALWKRQFGTPTDESVSRAATDQQGNVYLVGVTDGSLGGPNQGSLDAWIAKLSATGALLWKRQPGTPKDEAAEGVATDEEGDVFITGRTSGSLAGPNQGSDDAWIKKYSPAGAVLWKRQIGTPSYDVTWGIATDGKGGVYIAGVTGGSIGGGNRGMFDAFIVKFQER